ncbi:MAG: DNA polymerase III subunit delta' [Candidatus Cloacimonetes bacterium]|mgnify:CR=1 FL=1|jgi:DNA polymerase-3 subunit delta'|nr:DNA polymerase III subunit delta' [Candidatus Cloacimonadota bacterium]MDD2423777.1 DNA polymerase III subunit delta' [Candidatus Cloacimonadota bacterium]MDD3562743.1 DNA polymerase III subunit delta' [Candidatus Cloacimonadota bacterium]MDD4277404.1 DNA polymerase III subunit delta' [Candidatus Cloacimonadota bacterium]MDY0326148.1 DNA polymerase III subunit delta' [Candidatus Cloacimonadaceae bacterium]
MFRKIKGQSQVIGLLQGAIEQERIAQAYLFHGGDGVGKFMTALYFGMAVNCLSSSEYRPCGVCASCHKFLSFQHPDFIYLFPTVNLKLSSEGEIKDSDALKQYEAYIKNKTETPWQDFFFTGSTEIRKDSMSQLIQRLELSIHEGQYRVVIIENADMMNTQTANAFLKTLEEPPPRTLIVLITERLPQLLPTIISRCQPVYFKPLSQRVIQDILFERFQVDSVLAKSAARISGGNLKTAIRIAQDTSSSSRDKAFELIQMAAGKQDLEYLNQLKSHRDSADAIRDLIAYLGIIANDLCVVHFCQAEVTNLDKSELLSTLSHEQIADRIPDYLLLLDDLNRKLEGNVNPTLIQINLFLATKNLLCP